MPSVLDGVSVIDLSWGVAGPVAGMLLGDHGADIIKVEPPGGGDYSGQPRIRRLAAGPPEPRARPSEPRAASDSVGFGGHG